MRYCRLQRSSGMCMGHSITSKEVVKYFLRAVNLLLVGFVLNTRFSSRKEHEALSRAVRCLQSLRGSGRYSGFAVSRLAVAPGLAEPPLKFPDGIIPRLAICRMVPNTHLPNEGLGRVYRFLLVSAFLEGYLLMGRRGGSFPSYVSPEMDIPCVLGGACEE